MRLCVDIIVFVCTISAAIIPIQASDSVGNHFGSMAGRFRRAIVASRPHHRARRMARFDVTLPAGTSYEVSTQTYTHREQNCNNDTTFRALIANTII